MAFLAAAAPAMASAATTAAPAMASMASAAAPALASAAPAAASMAANAANLAKISQSMPMLQQLQAIQQPSMLERFANFYKTLNESPLYKLSMNMLEQGGPQMRPHSVGQDLARSVRGVQDDQDADLVRQQNQMKVQQMKQANDVATRWFQDNYGNYDGGISSGQRPLTPPPARLNPPRGPAY